MPTADHLAAIRLLGPDGQAESILNQPGSQGSVRVYAYLVSRHGSLDAAAAAEGLVLYAEHTEDALIHPGKHPKHRPAPRHPGRWPVMACGTSASLSRVLDDLEVVGDLGGLGQHDGVYPREIEEELYMHPKVMDAVIIGIPDPYRGETVKAFVVPKPGVALTGKEVLDFCKTRLAAYKMPKVGELREALPETMVGKVLRRQLRAEELSKSTND